VISGVCSEVNELQEILCIGMVTQIKDQRATSMFSIITQVAEVLEAEVRLMAHHEAVLPDITEKLIPNPTRII